MQEQIPLFVQATEVVCMQPSVLERFSRRVRKIEITFHQHRAAETNLADFARRQFLTIGVSDRYPRQNAGAADRFQQVVFAVDGLHMIVCGKVRYPTTLCHAVILDQIAVKSGISGPRKFRRDRRGPVVK